MTTRSTPTTKSDRLVVAWPTSDGVQRPAPPARARHHRSTRPRTSSCSAAPIRQPPPIGGSRAPRIGGLLAPGGVVTGFSARRRYETTAPTTRRHPSRDRTAAQTRTPADRPRPRHTVPHQLRDRDPTATSSCCASRPTAVRAGANAWPWPSRPTRAEFVDASVLVIGDHLWPTLVAGAARSPRPMSHTRLRRYSGHPMSKAALEAAVLDAQLRADGTGLHALLRRPSETTSRAV